MKAIKRPDYIQQKAHEMKVKKVKFMLKTDPELRKFWKIAHNDLPKPKLFPSRDCEIAWELGKRNHEAADMDD